MDTLKYSVLRFSPSKLSGERINIGMIIIDETSGERMFYISKRYASRLMGFTDGETISGVEDVIYGINDEINAAKDGSFDLDKYTEYYINDFMFDHPKTIEYTDKEKTIDQLKMMYFQFDLKAEE